MDKIGFIKPPHVATHKIANASCFPCCAIFSPESQFSPIQLQLWFMNLHVSERQNWTSGN